MSTKVNLKKGLYFMSCLRQENKHSFYSSYLKSSISDHLNKIILQLFKKKSLRLYLHSLKKND